MSIGVIDYAVPVGVFPWHLAKTFRQSQSLAININQYANGESQRRALAPADFPRRTWEMEVDLSAAQAAELRDFYVAHKGPLIPFVFYDVSETIPYYSYDASGAALDGRYLARFNGSYEMTMRVGRRGSANLSIVEVV